MIEPKRGCGHRVLDGLYIVGSRYSIPCDRLPFKLEYCPVCGSGIKFTRGYQMVNWEKFAGEHKKCKCKSKYCPVCHPEKDVKHAVMWVGEKYYSIDSFNAEAVKQGVCKRIASVPRDITIGKTWIFLAHKKAVVVGMGNKKKGDPRIIYEYAPGVFHAFRPIRIEKIITRWQARDKQYVEKLRKLGITILVAKKYNRKTHEVYETALLEK